MEESSAEERVADYCFEQVQNSGKEVKEEFEGENTERMALSQELKEGRQDIERLESEARLLQHTTGDVLDRTGRE